MQQGRQVSVSLVLEILESPKQVLSGVDHVLASHILGVNPASFPFLAALQVTEQLDQEAFERVVIAVCNFFGAADGVRLVAHRTQVFKQIVFRALARRTQLGQIDDPVNQAVALFLAIEGTRAPRFRKVPPLDQLPARALELVERRLVLAVVAEGEASETTAKPGRRRAELLLTPAPEDLPVKARGLDFRKLFKRRIDVGLDGPLAQDFGAEGMNRADARLLQTGDGVFKILQFESRNWKIEIRNSKLETGNCRLRIGSGTTFAFAEFRISNFESRISSLRQRPVQLLPQAQLQLARRLSGEGDSHHVLDRGQPFLQDRNDPVHELGGLPRTRRRLDNQALFERAANPVSGGLVVRTIGERNHGWHRTRWSASSLSRGLRFTLLSS